MDESPYIYGYLCDLIEANHPAILGNQNSNIPKIIEIFAEAFSCDALPPSHEVYGRMVNITRQVQVSHCVQKIFINKPPYCYSAYSKNACSNF